MRNVPFVLKFSLTCSVSMFMCYRMWEDHIYDPELYKLAVKYRENYDHGFKEKMAIRNYEESSA